MKKQELQRLEDYCQTEREICRKHYTILNYILNKNSRSLAEGGVDFEKMFDEVQDFEQYLVERMQWPALKNPSVQIAGNLLK